MKGGGVTRLSPSGNAVSVKYFVWSEFDEVSMLKLKKKKAQPPMKGFTARFYSMQHTIHALSSHLTGVLVGRHELLVQTFMRFDGHTSRV